MKSPDNPREALWQSLLLWMSLSETGSPSKVATAEDVLGYIPAGACPCCEYAANSSDGSCHSCPVSDWSSEKGVYKTCSGDKSPYLQWTKSVTDGARKVYANYIVKLLLEELNK